MSSISAQGSTHKIGVLIPERDHKTCKFLFRKLDEPVNTRTDHAPIMAEREADAIIIRILRMIQFNFRNLSSYKMKL